MCKGVHEALGKVDEASETRSYIARCVGRTYRRMSRQR